MYQPKYPPLGADAAGLASYITDEFQSVAQAASDPVDFVQFNVLHAEPARPREGMECVADGTDWNPTGAGAGKYLYIGGAWTKL